MRRGRRQREDAPRAEPLPEWVRRETEDWDQITRLTPRVGRFIALFFPAWFAVLALLGFSGGPLAPRFGLGTILAALIAWRLERRWTARRDMSAGSETGVVPRRRAMGPVGAAAIGAGVVLVAVYMIWVLSTAS